MLRAGIISGQRVTKEKLERSRELHREMTPAEKNPVTGVTWEQIGSPFAEQDKVLSGVGLRIVRFVNEDVVRNLHEVVERIRELIAE